VADGVIAQRIHVVRAEPFIATAFIGAGLIFLVQPMFARMATPLLGGAPAVWNVSLVCFQAALLAGYAYAHVLQRLGSIKTQVMVHAFVLVAGYLCLPLRMSELMGPPPATGVQLWLIGTFAVSIAPPFAALSATAPLIQAWYARSGLKDAADPYHLYAASNIGSLIGLAAYPLLIEPFSAVADQTTGWMIGYVVLAFVLLYAGWSITRGPVEFAIPKSETANDAQPTWRKRTMWLALSFVPSSLLVGATTHITTDVAAAPFLWAPPLMIYLLTFVLAFAKKPLVPHSLAVVLAPLAAAFAALMLSGGGPNSLALMLGSDLFALFIIALACHGAMNAQRPGAQHLTQFYLIMSLGGVLGGAFNALLAPVIFDNVYEYPLMLIAGVALLSVGGEQKLSRLVIILLVASAATLVAALVMKAGHLVVPPALRLALIAPSVAAIILSRRAPLGAAIALACAWPTGATFEKMQPTWAARSFFGVVKIIDAPATDGQTPVRMMLHGTTIHGAQSTTGDILRPRTYYAPATPIGQALRLYSDAHSVGVVGLGIGSTACYSRPDQDWTFFEIDPLVVKVASDPSRFTFLSSCRPNADIVVGDARIKLAGVKPRAYDVLLLDAFSSDSVPTHLLTKEAMSLYLDKLSANGVLVFHISNRHLALAQVVARVTEAAGAHALRQVYHPTPQEFEFGASASEVVLVSRDADALDRARTTGKWDELKADGQRPWTDDYSNIIGAMIARSRGE
jgi:hypothetical protein